MRSIRVLFQMLMALGIVFSMTSDAKTIGLPHSSIEDLKNWRAPKDTLFDAEWRSLDSARYLKRYADFNGDGIIDTAKILEPVNGNGIGIFVFLGDSVKSNEPICLFKSDASSLDFSDLSKTEIMEYQHGYRLSYGITVAGKGNYLTACGRGFYDCDQGEPEDIHLTNPGIYFFQYDAGYAVVFYWDLKRNHFVEQEVGD